MEGLFFSTKLDEERTLFIAPLTNRHLASCGSIGDISGYFLFEMRGTGDFADIEVIARVPNEDGVLRLRRMLGMT